MLNKAKIPCMRTHYTHEWQLILFKIQTQPHPSMNKKSKSQIVILQNLWSTYMDTILWATTSNFFPPLKGLCHFRDASDFEVVCLYMLFHIYLYNKHIFSLIFPILLVNFLNLSGGLFVVLRYFLAPFSITNAIKVQCPSNEIAYSKHKDIPCKVHKTHLILTFLQNTIIIIF